jgi:ATP-dependent Clp protease ATP-binding subunit ClpB
MSSDIRLTPSATTFISSAHDLASDHAHAQLTPLHLALVLLDPPPQSPSSAPPSSTASPPLHKITTLAKGNPQILDRSLKKALVRLPSTDPPPDSIAPSPAFGKVLRTARDISALSVAEIDTWHLVCAVARDASVGRALQEAGVSEAAVDDAIKSIRVKQMGRDNVGKGKAASGGSSVDEDTSSLLTKYTIDLTELARQDNFEPFVGREPETRRIMTILTRRRGNSVLLLGEHGAGKTALISCLASRISNRTAPPSLLSAKLLSLDISLLTSASEAEIRQNILAICQAVASSPNSILVIDDIELLLPVCANTASIVCPLLSTPSDPLRIIATTTPSFHEAIISSSPLSSALQHLPIPPLTTNTPTSMLLALKSNYEI